MDNNELLQKVVDTTLIGSGGGGILNPEQADRFIDYMVDQTVLVKECRVVRMNAPTREVDKIAIGTRLVRKATENVDDHVDADPTFSKISLQTVKLRLDWRLTTESLEDNIEGEALEDHVARLMATQMGNDLEDLYINGDLTSNDALLKALEGWRKLALNGAHVVSNPSQTGTYKLSKESFNTALKAVPNKYLQRRSELKFYNGSGMLQDFLNGLTDRSTPLGDAVIFGARGPAATGGGPTNINPFGIPVTEVPLFSETLNGTYSGASGNHGFFELTFPNNRIVGIQREIKVYREFLPKTDAIEYTVYTRVANQVENLDAWVYVKDVKIQA
jgi:Phage capsid family